MKFRDLKIEIALFTFLESTIRISAFKAVFIFSLRAFQESRDQTIQCLRSTRLMLRSLSLDNFRAFKSVAVDFSKLNIFVGPNNSGKSSLISAVNLIAQNFRSSSQEFSLILNGPYAQLGTFYDAVHGHSARSTIGLHFQIDQFAYSYTFKYRTQRREIELTRAAISSEGHTYTYRPSGPNMHEINLGGGRKIFPKRNPRVRFHGLQLYIPFIGISGHEDALLSDVENRKLRDFLFRSVSSLERTFSTFDAVGAFRSAPERTYHYTGEAPSNVGRFGENFAQMLVSTASRRTRPDLNFLRRVSTWFADSGVARSITINSLTNRHFEILIEDNTGSANNIFDSGFGCSQVLPVLVGGVNLLSNKSARFPPMYVVQEPEIHLHPTAAAHLGTYFSQLARDGVQCFVETHSENLILRVATHVASGDLTPDDVRIYWVSGNSGEHTATPMIIRPDGTFESDWPEGFFPARAAETMRLARAASESRLTQKRDVAQ